MSVAPQLPAGGDSCTHTSLLVARPTDDRVGVERHDRARVDDLDADAFGRRSLGRLEAPACASAGSRPRSRRYPGRTTSADRAHDPASFNLASISELRLVLEDDHRIVIADRAAQQTVCIGRGAGHGDEARHVQEPVRRTASAAAANPTRRRSPCGSSPAPPPVRRSCSGTSRAGWRSGRSDAGEVGEHHLGDRAQPAHGRAEGGADDRLLGDRRIAHASRAEPVEQPLGRLEHAAGRADVLAEQNTSGSSPRARRPAPGMPRGR